MNRTLPVITACMLGLIAVGQSFAADENFAATVEALKPYYIKEGVNFGLYTKVLVDSLKVADARVIAPPWYDGDDKGPKKWQLTKKDIEFLRQSYRDAMVTKIEEEGGYEVVETAAEDAVTLDVQIVTLTPYARKGEKVQVRGFGELRAQATLRDSMTGDLLGIFEGVQQVGSEYQQNTRMNSENSLRSLFEVWGARMRRVMDDSRN